MLIYVYPRPEFKRVGLCKRVALAWQMRMTSRLLPDIFVQDHVGDDASAAPAFSARA
jgi:hypothetical protein